MKTVFEIIPDDRDRKLLELMLEGERKTAAYADILGLKGDNDAKQREIVKRHKDRLKKRLERLGVKLRE